MAFSLESRIGRGRTAETFFAKLEVGTERLEVVVKRPRAELAGNGAFAAAFVDWGSAEKELDHEGVVAVLEAGVTADGPYVIQERVDGAPLAVLLEVLRRQKRTLSLPLALAIAERVAAAVAYLHGARRAHGGLDPGEILLSRSGEVKLGDQRLHTLDPVSGLGAADGDLTTVYRAPELLERPGSSSPAGDVFSLGLILLEMLIGHRVWTSAAMTVAGSVRALTDFSHVGQARPELTAELVEILQSSTASSPLDRVASAFELHAGLSRVIDQHRVRADAAAIGAFVSAAIPPPAAEEAPTRLVDPEAAAELARRHARAVAAIASAAVEVDPDVEKKALSRVAAAPPPPLAPSPPSPSGAAPSPRPRATRLEVSPWMGVAVIGLILALLFAHMMSKTGEGIRQISVLATSEPPGAELRVNGERAGQTPVDAVFPTRDGRVTLRFELAGYATHELTFEPKDDELRYEANLSKAAAEATGGGGAPALGGRIH